MQNASSSRAVSARRRKARTVLGMLGVVGLGLLGLRWIEAMQTPMVVVPNPALPNPNAFDFYVAAGNAVTSDDQMKPEGSYTLAQREAFVQQDAGAVDTLHEGFAYSYLQPPCRSYNMLFPYYSGFRQLARLLALRGQVQAELGNWSGAVDSYLDALRLGIDIPHGATLIGVLNGIGCQYIGRKSLWDAVEHLNAAQSHAALDRMKRILERRLPFADSLQEEKWAGQAERMAIFRDAGRCVDFLMPSDMEHDPLYPAARSLSGAMFMVYSKRRIMDDFTAAMDQNIRQARQPYMLHLPDPPECKDPINRVYTTVFRDAWWKDVECETQNELLVVMLALHAYRLEKGCYPATLTELAPIYLSKLPDDPYALQGGFHYRLQGTKYSLYSIGPDGKDDGGTPIDDPKVVSKTNPRARYRVNQQSHGDILAGRNTF